MSGSIPIFSAVLSAASLATRLSNKRNAYKRDLAKEKASRDLFNQERRHRQKVLQEQAEDAENKRKRELEKRLARTKASLVSRGLRFGPASGGGALLRTLRSEGGADGASLRRRYDNEKYAEDLRFRRNLLSLSAPSYPDIFKDLDDYIKR